MAEHQDAASRSKGQGKGKKRKGKKRSRLSLVVDRSTETVERFHRAIASWPLDALERVRRLEAPVARVRKLQERSITASYEFVRGVNREVAQLVRKASRDSSRGPGVGRVEKAKVKRGVRPEAVATAS